MKCVSAYHDHGRGELTEKDFYPQNRKKCRMCLLREGREKYQYKRGPNKGTKSILTTAEKHQLVGDDEEAFKEKCRQYNLAHPFKKEFTRAYMAYNEIHKEDKNAGIFPESPNHHSPR